MKKELELSQFIAKRLKKKGKVMLLVVLESIGSSPGRQGFKMVVDTEYRTDAVVVRQLLDKNLRYLGVLGSTSKRITLLEMLKNEGFSNDILRGVHTPIGLTINSQTPEEIAVSIAAEIILIKNRLKFNT